MKQRKTRKRMKPAPKKAAGKIVTKSDTVALSKPEAAALDRHEEVIAQGRETFVAVGQALKAIRDERLYRASHKTFEAYCQERWGYKRAHAYRIIEASGVVAGLSPIGDKPIRESQARELAAAPPEERAEVFSRAAERAGGEPTAADIRREIHESDDGVRMEPVDGQDGLGSLPGSDATATPAPDACKEAQGTYDACIRALDAFARQVRDLADSAAGRGLVRTNIDQTLADLRGAIRMARPVGKCHRCGGEACDTCRTGWVTLAEFRALPAKEQAMVAREGGDS